MQTNITRLQFILRFAAMALPTMRAGDLLNLREESWVISWRPG